MKIQNSIKLNSYAIISEAVERGISAGYRHSYKHIDTPDEDMVKEHIYQDIMNELSEIIVWFEDNA